MADTDCKLCGDEGWYRGLVDSDHGTFYEDIRCFSCNQPKWPTVFSILLARNECKDSEKVEKIDAILDEIMLNLDRSDEDELKKLLEVE
jgi:hypothetical protein